MLSKYQLYSIGIVTKDKDTDSDIIDAMPIEVLSEHIGDTAVDKKVKSTSTSEFEDKDTTSLRVGMTLKAVWLPRSNTNRITPPNVVKGESVEIYRYGNSDNYYWSTFMSEPDKRRKEKVTYLFGNPSDGNKDPLDADNSYWFTIDAIGKKLRLHTPDNDGEFTTYDFEINGETGELVIKDGQGIYIKISSRSKSVKINADTIELIAKKKILLDTPVVEATGDIKCKECDASGIKVSKHKHISSSPGSSCSTPIQ